MRAKYSAYLAFPAALLSLAGLIWTATQSGPALSYLLPFLVVGATFCIVLLIGAKRTVDAKSGGLRLLSAAWGAYTGCAAYIAANDVATIVALKTSPRTAGVEPDWLGLGVTVGVLLVSATGWFLVTTHKEK